MIALLTQPAAKFASRATSKSSWANAGSFAERRETHEWLQPFDDPEEPSDLDDPISPIDDDRWDVFLPDDDPDGPRPKPGDFWIDADEE